LSTSYLLPIECKSLLFSLPYGLRIYALFFQADRSLCWKDRYWVKASFFSMCMTFWLASSSFKLFLELVLTSLSTGESSQDLIHSCTDWNMFLPQANLWIIVFSYVGNYFWTHYFFKVLGASYTFPSWKMNNVSTALSRQICSIE